MNKEVKSGIVVLLCSIIWGSIGGYLGFANGKYYGIREGRKVDGIEEGINERSLDKVFEGKISELYVIPNWGENLSRINYEGRHRNGEKFYTRCVPEDFGNAFCRINNDSGELMFNTRDDRWDAASHDWSELTEGSLVHVSYYERTPGIYVNKHFFPLKHEKVRKVITSIKIITEK